MALTSDNNIDIAAEQPRLIDAALTMRIASAILVLHTGTCSAPAPATLSEPYNCIARALFSARVYVLSVSMYVHSSPMRRKFFTLFRNSHQLWGFFCECRCMLGKRSYTLITDAFVYVVGKEGGRGHNRLTRSRKSCNYYTVQLST